MQESLTVEFISSQRQRPLGKWLSSGETSWLGPERGHQGPLGAQLGGRGWGTCRATHPEPGEASLGGGLASPPLVAQAAFCGHSRGCSSCSTGGRGTRQGQCSAGPRPLQPLLGAALRGVLTIQAGSCHPGRLWKQLELPTPGPAGT